MGVRGRTSAAALSVIGLSGIETIRRPDAPDELTSEQAAEWQAVVNRMPADWFPRETHAMLVQYCRLLIRARRLAQLIDAAENAERFDVDAYRDLVRSEEAVSRAIASLATKMRISQQVTRRREQAHKPSQVKAPWDAE